jgi:LysM repeat protein
VVQSGETIFCIGRAYGVLPGAIAQANGLPQTFTILPGQVLQIPEVQWIDIPDGPVCAPQFISPFPGLPFATPTPLASPTPVGPPPVISLNYSCISNCGSKEGDYVVRIQVIVSSGLQPYTFTPPLVPGQQYIDITVPHCTTGQGIVIVTAADYQSAQASWKYEDVACPSH